MTYRIRMSHRRKPPKCRPCVGRGLRLTQGRHYAAPRTDHSNPVSRGAVTIRAGTSIDTSRSVSARSRNSRQNPRIRVKCQLHACTATRLRCVYPCALPHVDRLIAELHLGLERCPHRLYCFHDQAQHARSDQEVLRVLPPASKTLHPRLLLRGLLRFARARLPNGGANLHR